MNTFKLITTFLLLTLCSYSFGQFGGLIKKPKKPSVNAPKTNKSKATQTTSSTSTSSSSNTTLESNRNKDGTPKYNSEDPTYKAYSSAKEKIKFSKNIIEEDTQWHLSEEKTKNAAKYLKKAKESLDFLNEQDSEKNQSYLKEFNESYAALNTKFNHETAAFNKKETYEKNIKSYESWIRYGNKNEDSKLDFSYQGFYNEIANYKKDLPDAFEKSKNTQAIFKNLDDYFTNRVYNEIKKPEEDAAIIIEAMYKKQLWEGHENYHIEAESYLRKLEAILPNIPSKDKLKDETIANALKAKITKETTLLKEYINSGQLEAAIKQRNQERIDAVRLSEKEMSNSAYEKMALDRSFDDGKKIIRAVIVSSDWQVVKNALDVPKYKSLWYSIAVKDKDGVCYKASGELRKDHEGGGKYGNPKFLFSEIDTEMNCDNVNK